MCAQTLPIDNNQVASITGLNKVHKQVKKKQEKILMCKVWKPNNID